MNVICGVELDRRAHRTHRQAEELHRSLRHLLLYLYRLRRGGVAGRFLLLVVSAATALCCLWPRAAIPSLAPHRAHYISHWRDARRSGPIQPQNAAPVREFQCRKERRESASWPGQVSACPPASL